MREFLAELSWRGLVQDQTPGLAERLARGPITAYVGFDPTAPSLQVGNLVPVMLLAHLQRAGGRPIVVMGGGTGMVGDPSGKRTERPLLTVDALDGNIARQRAQFERLLPGVTVVNNADWLRPLSLLGFLRDVGKHFTISYMLQKESVRHRVEEGLSYTEFSYMLTQAYDFLHLFRTERCELQMGATDQWGNITAGIELIRRADGAEVHCLCAPLFTTASGAKFGKSEGAAVWLDPAATPPEQFYNFWVNMDDRDVDRCLRTFTFQSREEIGALMHAHAADPGARVPHHELARLVTGYVHGQEVAAAAAGRVRATFAARGSSDMSDSEIRERVGQIAQSMPGLEYRWPGTPPTAEDLFVFARLASSKGDARRLLAGNGLKLNFQPVEAGRPIHEGMVISTAVGPVILLQKGKKTFTPIRIVGLSAR